MTMAYKPTFLDRHGPDGVRRIVILGRVFMVMVLTTVITMLLGGSFFMALGFGLVAGLGVLLIASLFSEHFGAAFGAFIWPSGSSTPYRRQFSLHDSLVARGRIDEAVKGYEDMVLAEPEAVDVRMRLADLCAAEANKPARAAELYRQLRTLPGVTPEEDLYASNRLVDLLIGPLGEPGRAVTELRRIVERYPQSRDAAHAREAIPRVKQMALSKASGAAR